MPIIDTWLDDILSKPTIDSSKVIDLKSYETVHSDDLEPVSIINPDLNKGPWIAGGACLRWYQNQPVGQSDIDVFCANMMQAQALVDRIKSYGRFTVKYESENAITLDHHDTKYVGRWTIQIIIRRFFANIDEVISSFDISVCEIGTAGFGWSLGPTTARDIREKNLRFKLPLQPDAPKRLTKYWVYGYRPVEGTIEAISSNPSTRWSFTNEEDYNNAF